MLEARLSPSMEGQHMKLGYGLLSGVAALALTGCDAAPSTPTLEGAGRSLELYPDFVAQHAVSEHDVVIVHQLNHNRQINDALVMVRAADWIAPMRRPARIVRAGLILLLGSGSSSGPRRPWR